MSKRKGPEALELPLDLPLHANDEQDDTGGGAQLLEETPEPTPDGAAELAGAADLLMGPDGEDLDDEAEPEDLSSTGFSDLAEYDSPAPFRDRVLSGLLDLGIQLLVLGATVAAVHAMGIALAPGAAVPFALLGLIFSFLYWFIPLAFWGQTPGMAWVGNSATSLADEPLTFGQSVLRWLGALLTLALAGLPLLLALGGRSLTDRLSDSKTVVL